MPLILASGSKIRQRLLGNAGIEFNVVKPNVDESELQNRYVDDPLLAALELAKLKAATVSKQQPESLVLGADQTLGFDGKLLSKPNDLKELKQRLMKMQGNTHYLCGGYAAYFNSELVWYYQSHNKMSVRSLTERQINNYVNLVGNEVLNSVGGYHLEGIGLQLFDKLKGDLNAMYGLALMAVLNFLYEQSYVNVKGVLSE